jgi:hypothetical protein
MTTDWRETTNLAPTNPAIVARLTALATRLVQEGRSTPGAAQANDGPTFWPELTWLPEAPRTTPPSAKKKQKAKAP